MAGLEPLAGLTALVTGGASGIGLAAAELLALRGAHVAVVDRAPASLPAQLLSLSADVTDQSAVSRALDQLVGIAGGLDIVVNCAGIGAVGTIEETPDADWIKVFEVNVLGIVHVTRAALPHLRASSAASVVNVCSIAATAGLPRRAAYSASKGAVLALTQAMAADHLAEGIRVNAVSPGTAATPWVQRLLAAADDPDAARRELEARQPQGRLVTADEVAEAIAYLAGPGSASTTGANLAVDGGMSGLRLPPAR
jgi:NAD(P)-dependent dehydrogenase (short-subunit alcohol dehydrogenase family)